MKRNLLILAVFLCAVLALASPLVAGQMGSGASTPTTAVFRDNCFTWIHAPCSSEPQDRIGSDSNGVWPFPYTNGVDAVGATINAVGDFELDTNRTSGRTYRTLYLDFGLPLVPPPTFPFPNLTHLFVDAYLSTSGAALNTLTPGTTRDVGLLVNFEGYSLRFGWDAGTTQVQVSCVEATSNNVCDTWVIEASPASVAKLLKISRKGQAQDLGNFYMPFSLTIQKLTR